MGSKLRCYVVGVQKVRERNVGDEYGELSPEKKKNLHINLVNFFLS
jgi:hypothetical protein